MVLIETNYKSFDEYLSKLSKSAYKNYKFVLKHNTDLVYKKTDFSKVREFMELWSRQLVRGQHPVWAFPVETVREWYDTKQLMIFECQAGLQFIQRKRGYWDCHPPLYDKEKYESVYLAKFMWFNLIKYAIENGLGVLNMGGGIDTSWREMIKRRKEFKNPLYKWMYVPEQVKQFPDKQIDYSISKSNILVI